MKKTLLISASIVAVLLSAVFIAPLFLKNTVLDIVKRTADDNMNAALNFSDADISLLRDFPRASVEISNISIANLPPFHDTLFQAEAIRVSLDLWTLIADSRVEILALHLDSPNIFAHIARDSTKNWNIAKSEEKKDSGNMNIRLRDISIKNGRLAFWDEAGGKRFAMNNITMNGEADYSNNICDLSASVSAITSFEKGGFTMLDAVSTSGTASVTIDIGKQHYILKDNQFKLNELPLSVDGTMDMAEKYMDFALNIKAPSSDFGKFLSIVPKMPSKSEELKYVSGNVSATAKLNGRMDDDNIPGFSLAVIISNGSFQGKSAPVGIQNIQMNLSVNNPDGKPDNTIIDLKNLTLNVGGDPFSLRTTVRNPISDPFIDAAMKGVINLAAWKNNLTLPAGSNIDGKITTDAALNGKMSAIKSKNFDKFTATGTIVLSNFTATASALPAPLTLRTAALALSPEFAVLSNLDGSIGASDFRAGGQLDNIIGFILADELLTGSLTVQSRKFDCNSWLGLSPGTQPKQEQTTSKPIELPDKVDFTFVANAAEVLYDNITARNVTARLRLKNKILTIENASMDAAGGNIAIKGSFDTRIKEKPRSDFELSLKKIDIAEAYKLFGTVQTFAPFLEYMRGNFDAKMSLETDLNGELKPDYSTLSSLGGLNIERIAVEGFKPFTQAAGLLKMEFLNNPSLTQIASRFAIEKGKFNISRTSLKFAGYDGFIQGSNGLDKSIDYTLTVNVPTGSMSQSANRALSGLLKKDMATFGNAPVPVNILFKGTFDNPQVSVSLDNAAASQLENAAKALQDEAKRKIDEEKAKLEQHARDEEQKLRQKIKEEEEKAKQKIRDEQDRLKKRAEEEAKKKAEELLKKSPFNPFGPK